jgi:hypothetical protein
MTLKLTKNKRENGFLNEVIVCVYIQNKVIEKVLNSSKLK